MLDGTLSCGEEWLAETDLGARPAVLAQRCEEARSRPARVPSYGARDRKPCRRWISAHGAVLLKGGPVTSEDRLPLEANFEGGPAARATVAFVRRRRRGARGRLGRLAYWDQWSGSRLVADQWRNPGPSAMLGKCRTLSCQLPPAHHRFLRRPPERECGTGRRAVRAVGTSLKMADRWLRSRSTDNCSHAMQVERFRPGDHLRLRRFGYFHHGIYIGDGMVVQFGGSAWEKPRAKIDEVPISSFEKRGHAEVVDHSRLIWLPFGLGWHAPERYEPERIVARARCLARTQPAGVYNLFGRNCETVANWCAYGMGESLQRQRVHVATLIPSVALSLCWSWLYGHRKFKLMARWQPAILVYLLSRLAWHGLYYLHNWRFYRDAQPCKDL